MRRSLRPYPRRSGAVWGRGDGSLRVMRGVVGVLLVATLAVGPPAPAEAKRAQPRPNIVLITSDDQPLSTFQRDYMPRTFRRLVDPGTSFTDAVVNVPLCCPSRATLLTGQYPHNHGVLSNSPGYGALRGPRNVLPVWLRQSGYRTAHFGKWLHGYEGLRGSRPAPGWGRWLTQLEPRRYYDYRLSTDGRTVYRGTRPRDHLTRVMTEASTDWVSEQVGGRRPLFLQLDYFAPHVGARYTNGVGVSRCIGAPEPAPRDRGTVSGIGAPRVPSFNEADISDKPAFARRPQLDAGELAKLDRRYRCTLESVAGVDRGIDRVVQSFQRAGELRNTAFVFLTDNGYFFGEHRIRDGKARPWEEAIRTPLVIRPPRNHRPSVAAVDAQAAEIDVPATIIDLAGAAACRGDRCRTLDGRSLLPALRGRTGALERRAVLIEMQDTSRDTRSTACAFRAVRTTEAVLIESSAVPDPVTGRCEDGLVYESYDLRSDPFQLENLVPPPGFSAGAERSELTSRLDGLRSCSGIAGRDPRSTGGHCE